MYCILSNRPTVVCPFGSGLKSLFAIFNSSGSIPVRKTGFVNMVNGLVVFKS